MNRSRAVAQWDSGPTARGRTSEQAVEEFEPSPASAVEERSRRGRTAMGLLDSILGNMMGSGAGGTGPQRQGGSTSPIVKALMMLLTAKAFQHYTSNRQGAPAPSGDGGGRTGGGEPMGGGGRGRGGGGGGGPGGGEPMGGGGRGSGPFGDLSGSLDPRGGGMGQGGGPNAGGGLGGMLPGGLGGLLGGLVGGGGLGAIVDQFRQNGYGNQVDSWVGRGQNQRIAPNELEQALGPDTIQDLEQETGMPRDQMLSDLADELPDAVDQFTPEGRLPSEEEVSSRWV